jgi:energy-coupling factor transporter ATP-binding protein EcfA2
VYVEKLEITNVRCFDFATLEPRYPGRKDGKGGIDLENVTLLLGNNGAGKSTTLRSLAIGVLSRVLEVSEYQPDNVVRKHGKNRVSRKPGKKRGAPKTDQAMVRATLRLGPLDRPPNRHPRNKPLVLTTHIMRVGDYERLGKQEGPFLPDLFVDLTPTFFLVGYGATRRMESSGRRASQDSKDSGLRFARVSSLFYDFVALMPLTSWLPHLRTAEKKRFQEIVTLMNKLLPPEIRFTGAQEERKTKLRVTATTADLVRDYVFSMDGQFLSFRALSDGYRAYIAWVADLIYHLCQCTPKEERMTDLTGLVLVDEIDLHLHPSWQREVMATVSTALPKLQFVCTTHSPIVAGTLKREQVFVMDRESDGSVQIALMHERLHGLNADQILTSSYFGLTTTRAPGFVDELRELRQKAWQGDGSATLEFLERMSGPTKRAVNSKRAKPAAMKRAPKKAAKRVVRRRARK